MTPSGEDGGGENREVPARLVAAAVFKTVGTFVKRWFGGFDSHALPLLSSPGGACAKHAVLGEPDVPAA